MHSDRELEMVIEIQTSKANKWILKWSFEFQLHFINIVFLWLWLCRFSRLSCLLLLLYYSKIVKILLFKHGVEIIFRHKGEKELRN